MRTISVATLLALIALSASAQTPLAPGLPAGILPAQGMKTTENYLFGIAALAAVGFGVFLVGKKSTSTTSTTP